MDHNDLGPFQTTRNFCSFWEVNDKVGKEDPPLSAGTHQQDAQTTQGTGTGTNHAVTLGMGKNPTLRTNPAKRQIRAAV